MYDFLLAFLGSKFQDYPFLLCVLSVIMGSVIFFMFYTIIARIFRVVK